MSTIVTRAGKGSALTHNEVDANFNNLNNDKIEAAQTVTLTNKTLSTGTAITDGTINNATIGASTPSSGAFTTLSATGVTTVQAGTVSAPAITTSGDTNTGIFFPAADTIAFTEGGVESMRINSSGNVGIGTSSPNYLLQVHRAAAASSALQLTNTASGSGATDGFGLFLTNALLSEVWQFENADMRFGTNNTERMRLDSSGNVGIGTSSPANILDVSKQSGTAWLTAPSTISAAGENYFNISVSGKNSAGTAYEAVRLGFSHDVSQASAIRAGAFTVSTHYSGTLTERLRIDSSGNLGLGVTPSAWRSANKALQIGLAGSLYSLTSAGRSIALGSNLYVDSGGNNVYITTGYASSYQQYEGAHTWYTAASGTAGNAITFTQVMAVEGGKSLALEGATSQSGTGITFPATQSASSNANTLDDYEEGTFTPTIVGTTTAGTATYSVQVGRYTKVGNRVLFEARVTYTGGTGTGNLRLAGLPFTSNANCQSSLAANYGNLVLTASNIAQCYVIGSSTSIAIEQYPTGGGAATSVAYDAAATILVAGHYEV